MEWLGLDYDEGPGKGGEFGPYIQSERLPLYQEYTQRLLDEGIAYKDYSTPEENDARRKKLEAEGVLTAADWQYRDLSVDQQQKLEAEGRVATIRVKMPDEGSVKWTDLVHGDMEFQYAVLEDWIAVKSDGFPTYNFACVVDDGLMEISHVLRGDDHVSNTPRQIHLFKELGFRVPKFAHMPMILGPDKKRLSKRHGAASVEEFRDAHWLSEAIVNYLALLGWSPGNDQEFFPVEQIIKKFSLKRLNNTAAVFDYEKCRHLNGEHMKAMKAGARTEIAWQILVEAGLVDAAAGDEKKRLGKLLGLLGNRFSHFDRTVPHLSAYFTDEYPVDPEGAAQIDAAALERLKLLADRYAGLGEFTAATAEEALRALADEHDEKAGLYIHASRFAISGSTSGPSLFDAMEVLGRDRVVARLRDPRLEG